MICESILVVEDDEAIRETVKQVLEVEGYNVNTSNNGQEALDFLRTSKAPCLILLDMMMPVMNGWQFLEMRKKNHQIAKLPCVVVSAVAESGSMSSATEVVRKPPDIDELLEVVARHCRLASEVGTQHRAA